VERERYLLKGCGADEKAVQNGLEKLLTLNAAYKSLAVVVPKLGDVKHTILVPVLGVDLARHLIKDGSVQTTEGVSIGLISKATFERNKSADAYLLLWATPETIQQTESSAYNAKAIIVVTWNPAEAAEWEETNAVETIYSSPTPP
jgi:hypothetical protein